MRSTILASLVLLTGCVGNQVKTPAPTPPPKVISVPYRIYVEIPDDFLVKCDWRITAPPSLALEVGRERKKCLKQYEAQFNSIRNIRGTPVEEVKSGK